MSNVMLEDSGELLLMVIALLPGIHIISCFHYCQASSTFSLPQYRLRLTVVRSIRMRGSPYRWKRTAAAPHLLRHTHHFLLDDGHAEALR